MSPGSESVFERIKDLLKSGMCDFRELEHGPTRTSEESALARGEPLSVGAKGLLLKTDDLFRLFVLPAHEKLDSSAVKRELGIRAV